MKLNIYCLIAMAGALLSCGQRPSSNSSLLSSDLRMSKAVSIVPTDCSLHPCRYVRAGASGNGSDWSNAYGSLPDNLDRGATYFVAAGRYPSYTFDDAESGSSMIIIKKAVASDHGTNSGWVDEYGNQAVFDSILRFDTGYYIFDGQVRNEDNWFDGAAYGFQVYHNNTENQNIIIGATYNAVASNVTIKHTYINAPYKQLPMDRTIAQHAVSTDTWGGAYPHTKLLFTRMYVHGSNNVWFLRNTDGAIVEYSASEGAQSNDANHGEIVNLYYTGANAVIRFNKWRDEFIGYGGTALVAITNPHNETAGGLSFYGNVAWNFEVGDAAVGFSGYQTSNNKVYNNTFVGGVGYNSGTAFGQGINNVAYNNLYINCKTIWFEGTTHDYNGYTDSDARGESHAQNDIATSIFKNYSGFDFTLAAPTKAGLVLPSPYNMDLNDVTRGADGNFDLGAYEYAPAASPTPSPSPTPTPIPSPTPTPTPVGDVSAPVIKIAYPANNSAVLAGSTVTITTSASDDVGITKIYYYVSGVWQRCNSSSMYRCNWRVPLKRNAVWKIKVRAYDASGKNTSTTISVTSRRRL